MIENKLNFRDTETAFADKSNSELKEKHRLFKAMSSPALVNIGTKMTNLALSLGLPISGIIKRTVYEQFCGGETIEECQKTIHKLGKSNIGAILDYSVEGKTREEDFDRTKEEILKTIKRAKGDKDIPFAVFKVTGIADMETLEKVSSGAELSEQHKQKWQRIQSRINELCEHAYSIDQQLLIDAEDYHIQQAIDDMIIQMMEKYNHKRPIIFNTVQLYRKDRLDFLKRTHADARQKGLFYGIKLVRGAYMEKERERAAEKGYPSPIHETKADTDRDYNAALLYCVENINDMAFVNGTHNEESTQLLVSELAKRNLPSNHPNANFSQLLGMSDNLSYILAKNNFNVSKYVPYGPVKDSVPYLSRRAQENTSVIGQVSRELELIEKEMKRRNI